MSLTISRNVFKDAAATQCQSINQNNPLLSGARRGDVNRTQVECYLHNLFHIFNRTPKSLAYGIQCALNAGQNELANFFKQKSADEADHDQWPQQDLRTLGMYADDILSSQIQPATYRLLEYGIEVLDTRPEGFLAYMFAFEYITVVTGEEFLDNLEQRCAIPRSAMTGVDYHVRLDKNHVEDDIDAIFQILQSDAEVEYQIEVLKRTLQLIDACLASIYNASRNQERSESSCSIP